MGNRAVVTNKNQDIGIYLHWNGGPESVCAFLTYAKALGVRGLNMMRHISLLGWVRFVLIF